MIAARMTKNGVYARAAYKNGVAVKKILHVCKIGRTTFYRWIKNVPKRQPR